MPDSQHRRVVWGLMTFSIVRIWGTFILTRDRRAMPSFSIWSPAKIGFFMIALDYFFYVYHRATHEASLDPFDRIQLS